MPVKTYAPKRYSCNGSQTIFPVSWGITKEADVVVIHIEGGVETTLSLTTHYTISKAGISWDDGFNVTTVSTYAEGVTLVIRRYISSSQETDLQYNDDFDNEVYEDIVDKNCLLIQQSEEELDRALKVSLGSAYTDLLVPDPVADMVLAWKADLSGFKNVTGANIGDLTVSDWVKNNLLDPANLAAWITAAGLDLDDVPNGTTYEKVLAASQDGGGRINQIEGDTVFRVAQTRHYATPLIGFSTDPANAKPLGRGIEFTIASGLGDYVYLPVILTDGAIVTRFSGYLASDGSVETRAYLMREEVDNTASGESMAEISGTAISTTLYEDTSITGGTIDNDAYKYYVRCEVSGTPSQDCWVMSAMIFYTITEPKP